MRDIAAIRNEAGNVVGIMPHPEHAVEALTGPSVDGLGLLHVGPEEPGGSGAHDAEAMTTEIDDPDGDARSRRRAADRHRGARGGHARRRAALRRAGPGDGRVREDQVDPRPPADRLRAVHVLDHVERALLVQVEQGAPAPVRREGAAERPAARRHGRERRRHRRSATSSRSPSRSSRTTTRASSSRTRARRPASAASCATSSPWAPARSR